MPASVHTVPLILLMPLLATRTHGLLELEQASRARRKETVTREKSLKQVTSDVSPRENEIKIFLV